MKLNCSKLLLWPALAATLLASSAANAQTYVIITNLLFEENFSSYSAGSLPTTTDAGGLWRVVTYLDSTNQVGGSASVVADDSNLFGQGTQNKFFRSTSTKQLTLDSPYFHPQDVAIFEFDFVSHYHEGVDGASRWLQTALKTGTGWGHITSFRLYNSTLRTGTADVPKDPSFGGNDKVIRVWTVLNNKATESITYDRPDGTGTETLGAVQASVWIYHYETSTWEHLMPSYSFGRDANTTTGRTIDFVRVFLDSNAALRSFDMDNLKVYGSRAYVPPVYVAITNLLFKEDFEGYPVGSMPTTVAEGGQWNTATWTGTIGTVGIAEDINNVFGLGAANHYLQASNANLLFLTTPVFNPRQEVVTYAFDFVGHYYQGIDGARWLNVDLRGGGGTAQLTSLAMSTTSIRSTSASYGPNDSVVRVVTIFNNQENDISYDRPDGAGTANLKYGNASIWLHTPAYGWEQAVTEFIYSRTDGFPTGPAMDYLRFYLDSGVNRSFDLDNVEIYGSIKPIPLPVDLSAETVAGKVRVRWIGIEGSTYQVQYRTQLNTGDWTNLGEPIAASANGEQVFEEDLTETARFYRVTQLLE